MERDIVIIGQRTREKSLGWKGKGGAGAGQGEERKGEG
jgi:hypothetical protein